MQAAPHQCLRLAAIGLLDEAAGPGEQKINPADRGARRMHGQQTQKRRADNEVPQDRVHRRGMNRNSGKLREPADARARMRVADSRRFDGGAAMATALHQATQSSHRLNPWRGHGNRGERRPRIDAEKHGGNGANDRANQSTVEAHRPQERGRTLHPLRP